MKPNVAGALAYLLGFITGVIFLLISKDKFVRFHALQSIVVFLSLAVINYIAVFAGVLYAIVSPLVSIVALVLWIVLMVKAYRGEKYKVPFAGDIAEKYA